MLDGVIYSMEQWKVVNGYEKYEVSNTDRVRVKRNKYVSKQHLTHGYFVVSLNSYVNKKNK